MLDNGNDICRDGKSLWTALVQNCGLDLEDRDADLENSLKDQLNPNARDLGEALENTSTDQFIQAFFQLLQPFSLMYSQLLAFFEKAGASEGTRQLRLQVGDDFIDFKHFQKFIQIWNEIDCEIIAPAVSQNGAWILHNELSAYIRDVVDRTEYSGLEDVESWLSEYKRGVYRSFPTSLALKITSGGINDAANIVKAALSIIEHSRFNRTDFYRQNREIGFQRLERDIYHLSSIAQLENDRWLGSCVKYLARFLDLPLHERQELDSRLAGLYSGFETVSFSGKLSVSELKKILSLPAWKKRHECYSVWVATEILKALNDHKQLIHYRQGELKFPFVETKIADILTSSPRVSLYSECRRELINPKPVGRGRKQAVQPDFGIFRDCLMTKECLAVVEAKHYKNRSAQNFRGVLVDYANAHPKAEVILVNYGPVGAEFTDLPNTVADRCKMIGNLNPLNSDARDYFCQQIREIVGEPIDELSGDLIALDATCSMEKLITNESFWRWFAGLEAQITTVAIVNSCVRFVERRKEVLISKDDLNAAESLLEPIARLRKEYSRVIVVTDCDGLDSIQKLKPIVYEIEKGGPINVRLAELF